MRCEGCPTFFSFAACWPSNEEEDSRNVLGLHWTIRMYFIHKKRFQLAEIAQRSAKQLLRIAWAHCSHVYLCSQTSSDNIPAWLPPKRRFHDDNALNATPRRGDLFRRQASIKVHEAQGVYSSSIPPSIAAPQFVLGCMNSIIM